jgi:hypothetical protein
MRSAIKIVRFHHRDNAATSVLAKASLHFKLNKDKENAAMSMSPTKVTS